MKILRFAILALLLPTAALAQSTTIRNDDAATVVNPTNGQGASTAVDAYGRQWCVAADPSGNTQSIIPVSNSAGLNGPLASTNGYFNVGTDTIEAASTTLLLNLTAHAARYGDVIIPTGGTAANIDVTIPVCEVVTANQIRLCYPLPATPSTDAILIRRPSPVFMPKEDSAHTSGDAGIATFGVSDLSNSIGNFTAADGDYVPWKLTRGGVGNVQLNTLYTASAEKPTSILKNEDDATASADAGVAPLIKLQSALSVDAAANDYGLMKGDLDGRTMVQFAPAGEMWQSCSASNTGTADTEIKAAVASNRIYVTSISCFNTATVSSAIAFKDGATQIYVGGIGNSTLQGVAYWQHTLNVPLRGSVNTAFNFDMATNATATTCCAAGYISVN